MNFNTWSLFHSNRNCQIKERLIAKTHYVWQLIYNKLNRGENKYQQHLPHEQCQKIFKYISLIHSLFIQSLALFFFLWFTINIIVLNDAEKCFLKWMTEHSIYFCELIYSNVHIRDVLLKTIIFVLHFFFCLNPKSKRKAYLTQR